MIEASQTSLPSPPIPSATILLIRDGAPGLEVFMVKRHREVDFASGALVFPGGKVDTGDHAEDFLKIADKILPPTELTYRIAAIREAFEECGVLLCRPQNSEHLVNSGRAHELGPIYRTKLDRRDISFATFAKTEALEPACDLLTPFAHWITPIGMPKRFDTRFYLAAAPQDHTASHDGRETVDSLWANPSHLIREAEAKRATIVFATLMQLIKLSRANTVNEAIHQARQDPVVTVIPEFLKTPAGPILKIPREAGYGIEEMLVQGLARP